MEINHKILSQLIQIAHNLLMTGIHSQQPSIQLTVYITTLWQAKTSHVNTGRKTRPNKM